MSVTWAGQGREANAHAGTQFEHTVLQNNLGQACYTIKGGQGSIASLFPGGRAPHLRLEGGDLLLQGALGLLLLLQLLPEGVLLILHLLEPGAQAQLLPVLLLEQLLLKRQRGRSGGAGAPQNPTEDERMCYPVCLSASKEHGGGG